MLRAKTLMSAIRDLDTNLSELSKEAKHILENGDNEKQTYQRKGKLPQKKRNEKKGHEAQE